MSTMMEALLRTDKERAADATEADLRQRIAILTAEKRIMTAQRLGLTSGAFGAHHFMNEMERARAGIDHTGKPVRGVSA